MKLAVLSCLALLFSCTSAPRSQNTSPVHSIVEPKSQAQPPEQEVTESSSAQEPSYQVVKVFFATDRARTTDTDSNPSYSGKRSTYDGVTLGTAEISIPRDHRMGELEHPSLFRLEIREDPKKHVVLLKTSALTQDQFLNELQQRINYDSDKEALVFVHGYNVSFDEGARRLGQITYDLGFKGASILYSWPSRGHMADYVADEGTVDWTTPHFENFLQLVTEQTGARVVYVVAHSMGSRIVSRALKSIADKGITLKPVLKEVVMAAPDIDAGEFHQLASDISKAGGHFTLYESSNDKALIASRKAHLYARVGDTHPTLHIYDGFDCIDATAVDTSFLGHSYPFDNASMLGDIFDLFQGKDAKSRFRLLPRTLDGKPYWSFKK